MARDSGKGHSTSGKGTPAMLALAAAGVAFTTHEFAHDPAAPSYGLEAAANLGVDPDQVFKTLLVTVEGLPPPGLAVAIVPTSGKLSLKEIAVAVGAKRAEMCEPAVAERVTGYVVGGISPFGQKRLLPTVLDETAELFDTVFVSGGKRGLDVEVAPADLIRVLSARVAPIGI